MHAQSAEGEGAVYAVLLKESGRSQETGRFSVVPGNRALPSRSYQLAIYGTFKFHLVPIHFHLHPSRGTLVLRKVQELNRLLLSI